MGSMGNPDWEHAGNEYLARCISRVISLLNMWKNILKFPLCVSLHNSSSCGNVSFLTFQQCLYEKAIEAQSLAFTQSLKGFSSISCNRWNFWCQAVSLVCTLTGFALQSLLFFLHTDPTVTCLLELPGFMLCKTSFLTTPPSNPSLIL